MNSKIKLIIQKRVKFFGQPTIPIIIQMMKHYNQKVQIQQEPKRIKRLNRIF